jgi:hypothetical protein
MVYLALELCMHSSFLGVGAFAKSWGPFMVLFPLAVRTQAGSRLFPSAALAHWGAAS